MASLQFPYIGRDCLIHIFTFLNVDDLFNVSSVCKDWLEAAQTPLLWRGLCVRRWGVSKIAAVDSEQTRDVWKTHCLGRIHLENKMARGSQRDYTHKTLIGHTGRVVGLVYLQKNSPTTADPWSFRSTFCTASTDGTVRAWDVKDGVELWCSPVQSPLTSIVSVMEHGLVITSDSSGLIKSWHAHTGQEMASYPTASPYCTLLLYTINNSHFISVGTDSGTVETLTGITGPVWSKRSSLVVCEPFVIVDLLVLSPDKKWIFAGPKGNLDSRPKVFWADSLTKEDPLCQSLHRIMQSIIGCHAAVFMPDHPARLAVVYKDDNYGLIVQDISMKQSKSKSEIQVKKLQNSSLWLNNKAHNILLEAKDSDTLVLSDGEEFQVHFKGACTKFRHTDISSMSVDRFRMVVASHVYLKVFTWKKWESHKNEQPNERYQLGGSLHLFRHNWAFTHVVCDYSSIVGAVQCNGGKDELVAFSFTS